MTLHAKCVKGSMGFLRQWKRVTFQGDLEAGAQDPEQVMQDGREVTAAVSSLAWKFARFRVY